MATHIVLPPDLGEARKKFISILKRDAEPIVLVLWDDETAASADEFVQKIVEDNPEETSGMYGFVNFIIAHDPNSIIPVLKELENKSGADLDNLEDCVIVSISPLRNIVSEVVTKKAFNKGKGNVGLAVLSAWRNK